jgi:hypothetical protein
MRVSLAFMALSSASAVAPPRIELNLEGMANAYKLATPIMRTHDQGYVNNNHADASTTVAVKSRQDWTEKCTANKFCPHGSNCGDGESGEWQQTTATTCPFPDAAAYDHQDKEVDVTTRVFLVDDDGSAENTEVTWNSARFNTRSTYLFKYDAKDAAGNHAEQVVFALILDDTQAPFFDKQCSGATEEKQQAITVEAVSSFQLCELDARDNVDGTDIDPTGYKVDYIVGRDNAAFKGEFRKDFIETSWNNRRHEHAWASGHGNEFHAYGAGLVENNYQNSDTGYYNYSTASEWVSSVALKHVGKYLITYRTEDHAGVYGHNALNNERKWEQALLVRDRVKPTIYLQGTSPQYIECIKPAVNNTVFSAKYGTDYIGREIADTDDTNTWQFEAFHGVESDCRDQLDTVALNRYLPVTTTVANGIYSIVGNYNSSSFTDRHVVSGSGDLDTTHGPMARYLAHPTANHTLQYTCNDYANNDADAVQRVVHTVDTHKPTLHLRHNGVTLDTLTTHVVIYQTSNNAMENETHTGPNLDLTGQVCVDNTCASSVSHSDKNDAIYAQDSCDETISTSDVHMSWGPRAFNARILGDYVRTYTVTDRSANVATVTRTYTVVDNSVPTITVVAGGTNCDGCGVNTYEATRDEEYTDHGATCQDTVDGELSHAIEVSGEVVNMRIPGTYTIAYNCQDLSGNAAPEATREVVIQDTTNPELTLIGTSYNYVEAGFPYIDAGATATDTLDGDITQYIWTEGNTVDTEMSYYNMGSCEKIKEMHDATMAASSSLNNETGLQGLNNGRYAITVEESGEFKREFVACYFGSRAYTWKLHIAGDPACGSHYSKESWTDINDMDAVFAAHIKDFHWVTQNAIGNLGTFICLMQDNVPARDNLAANPYDFSPGTNSGTRYADGTQTYHVNGTYAEAGKFVIEYHVEDKAGNKATGILRTVVVRDTLPPVITLHLDGKQVHKSNSNQYGIDHHRIGGIKSASYPGRLNPAGYERGSVTSPGAYSQFGNPNLGDSYNSNPRNLNYMAEAASTNGWLIGAVASAVAGVALLGFSSRQTAVSVPV